MVEPDILQLRGKKPLFVGGTRYCYIHPQYPDRLVKVLQPHRTGAARKKFIRSWKRILPASSFDDQRKEIIAYNALQKRADPRVWEHIPEYFGAVETDMGVGIVTRLWRNADNSLPQNLQQELPAGLGDHLASGIENFVQWVLSERVLTRDLLPHNIIAVREQDQSFRLLVVDGIGNSELIPISSWFDFFARRKVARKVRRFRYRVSILLPEADRRGVYACNS